MNTVVLVLALLAPLRGEREAEWLRAQMESARHDLTTAEIKFCRFNGGRGSSRSTVEIEASVDAEKLGSGDLSAFQDLARIYFGRDFDEQELSTMKSRFLFDGLKTREELFSRIQTFDGINSVLTDARVGQASLGLAGGVGVRRLGIDDFRVLFNPDAADTMEYVGTEDGNKHFTAKSGKLDLFIDQENGLIRRMTFFNEDNKAARDIWQFGTIEQSGVCMPRCVLRIWYEQEKCRRIDAVVLTAFSANIEIDPEEFTQGVKKGVTVVDFRESRMNPAVAIADVTSNDVVAGFVPVKSTLFSTKPGNAGASWFVIAGNLFALLALALSLRAYCGKRTT